MVDIADGEEEHLQIHAFLDSPHRPRALVHVLRHNDLGIFVRPAKEQNIGFRPGKLSNVAWSGCNDLWALFELQSGQKAS